MVSGVSGVDCKVTLVRSIPVINAADQLIRTFAAKTSIGRDETHLPPTAPITSTVKGLSSEVRVGLANGLENDGAISVDNVVTIPAALLGRTLGFLTEEQERQLARAVILAFDLDVPLLG